MENIVTQGVENQDVAAPENNNVTAKVESADSNRNAYFADMRRKQQLERARADNARLKAQIDTAQKALRILSSMGLADDKNQPDSKESHLSTSKQSVVEKNTDSLENTEKHSTFSTDTVESKSDSAILNSYLADVSAKDNKISQSEVDENPLQRENQTLRNQLAEYQQREAHRLMAEDLQTVQGVNPTITTLGDLPAGYFALRFNTAAPMGAKQAYLAAVAIQQQSRQPKPASAGSVLGPGAEREFFTSDELDNLTSKMLDDSKIMEKALRSLARLKKERG